MEWEDDNGRMKAEERGDEGAKTETEGERKREMSRKKRERAEE